MSARSAGAEVDRADRDHRHGAVRSDTRTGRERDAQSDAWAWPQSSGAALAAGRRPARPGRTPRAGTRRARPGRRRASASGARGSRRRRRGGAPPRAPAPGSGASASERALGKRPTSSPMTATWSNSRPFVAWAVAKRQRRVVAAERRRGRPGGRRSRSRSVRRASRYGAAQARTAAATSAGAAASGSPSGSIGRGRPARRGRPRSGRGAGGPAGVRRRAVARGTRRRAATRASSSIGGGRNGTPALQRDRDRRAGARGSSGRGSPASPSSSGQRSQDPRRSGPARRPRPPRGRSDPARPAAARIVFANRSPLCSTSRTARRTTGRRAAVVDDRGRPAAGPAALVGQAEDPADVGQAPAVDRLVVVADEEDPVRRRGEEQREPELGPVEVLGLVDEQVGAARAPAREDVAVAPRGAGGRARRDRRSRGRPRRELAPRRRGRPGRSGPAPGRAATSSAVDAEVELQPRERACRAAASRPAPASGAIRAQHRDPIDAAARPSAPASRRISSPSAWNVRTRTARRASAERRQRRREPLAELVRGALVERDRGDRVRATPRRTRAARRSARRASSSCRCPAGATHRIGPGGAVAAARWSGARRSKALRDRRDGQVHGAAHGDRLPGSLHGAYRPRMHDVRAGVTVRERSPSDDAPATAAVSCAFQSAAVRSGEVACGPTLTPPPNPLCPRFVEEEAPRDVAHPDSLRRPADAASRCSPGCVAAPGRRREARQ